ncbi:MAG: hypothetical protein OXM03_03935 [Chloroflexota bacterium]|nr:hypothetical protein [Chloroflexota bacterium]MDE2839758.1 hypothetical protein [Chloroflexota bacterium]MDE2930302.1 hypothetical protein [Chloroflexota bacterium]
MKLTLDDYRYIGTELGRYIAEHVPGIDAAIYCKHHLGTLTPGFSDHDLRSVADASDAETWLALSRAGGESYLELLEEAPHYARILEHPPGFICSPDEAQQLLPLMGEVRDWERIGGAANVLDDVLAAQPPQFTQAQQHEACGKFKIYLVPRAEQFDPPINLLPEYLPYYPVYGALSHWFLPAAKLACGLLRNAWVPTKPAALKVLPEVVDSPELLDRLNAIVVADYRVQMSDEECAAMADELLEVVYELRDKVAAFCQQLPEQDAAQAARQQRLRYALQALAGIRGRFGIAVFFRHASPDLFDGEWLRMHLGEEIEALSTQFFETLVPYKHADFGPIIQRLDSVLNASALRLVTALYDAITPPDDMNDARLDVLMAIWPEYAALIEEEYRAKIAPLWDGD